MFKLLFLPFSLFGFSIHFDIGHNQKNPGAISSTCVGEFQYNKSLVQELLKIENTSNSKNINGLSISFQDRKKDSFHKDFFVSIHHDSVQSFDLGQTKCPSSSISSGFSIFVSKKNKFFEDSFRFAQILGYFLQKEGLKINTYHNLDIEKERKTFLSSKYGVYQYDDLIVLKNAESPAILLEAGVIVNPQEEEFVKSFEFKEKIRRAFENSINYYQKE